MAARQFIDIVFDGPPTHLAGRFVEVNGPDGASIRAGEWIEDGEFWKLRLRAATAFLADDGLFCCYLREYDGRACTNGADWEVQGPKGFEDNTHVCAEHLTEVLDPTEAYTITPIAGA